MAPNERIEWPAIYGTTCTPSAHLLHQTLAPAARRAHTLFTLTLRHTAAPAGGGGTAGAGGAGGPRGHARAEKPMWSSKLTHSV